MSRQEKLLLHLEEVHDEYVELVEKIPMEDKIILAHEEPVSGNLTPWEISEVVHEALNNLPEGLENHIDGLFDTIYDAVLEALDRARR